MNRELEIYHALVLIAFIAQLAIDLLGFLGVYYSAYDEKIFEYSGHEALLSFQVTFMIYLFWIALHYISLGLLAFKHFSAYLVIPLSLVLSFIQMPVGGIYVGTPFESTVGWISSNAYIFAVGMAIFSPKVSKSFKNSYELLATKNP